MPESIPKTLIPESTTNGWIGRGHFLEVSYFKLMSKTTECGMHHPASTFSVPR